MTLLKRLSIERKEIKKRRDFQTGYPLQVWPNKSWSEELHDANLTHAKGNGKIITVGS